MTGKIKAIKLR